MALQQQSPTNVRYLISLMPPQDIRARSIELASGLAAGGCITAPMTPMLPLLESPEPPRPPVTGSLPPCPNPLIPAGSPGREDGSPWWTWPVESGGWFADLAKALGGNVSRASGSTLFPLCRGIPLAAERDTGIGVTAGSSDRPSNPIAATIPSPGETPLRWRALNLECYEIAFESAAGWYLDLRWRSLWKRRLRRAPTRTNIDK